MNVTILNEVVTTLVVWRKFHGRKVVLRLVVMRQECLQILGDWWRGWGHVFFFILFSYFLNNWWTDGFIAGKQKKITELFTTIPCKNYTVEIRIRLRL